MADEKKYLDLQGLAEYDERIKALIESGDAQTIASLMSHISSISSNFDPAGTAQTKFDELANGAVASNTQAINILTGGENVEGSVKKQVADLNNTLSERISTAETNAAASLAVATGVRDSVGTVPQGQTVMEIIQTIQETGYDDTQIQNKINTVEGNLTTLTGRVDTVETVAFNNEELLGVLTGDGDGSIKKLVDGVINKFATDVSNDGVVNTYKELVDYVASHAPEAANMAGDIASNKTAIEALGKLIGELPENITDKDVLTYLQRLITEETQRASNAESGLDERLDALEEVLGDSEQSVSAQIEAAKGQAISTASEDATAKANKALSDAKSYVDGKVDTSLALVQEHEGKIESLTERMDGVEGSIDSINDDLDSIFSSIEDEQERLTSLETKIGEGFIAITTEEIDALFAEASE